MYTTKTFAMEVDRLDNGMAVEAWRRTLAVGNGKVVIMGTYETVGDLKSGRDTEATITATSYCCQRGIPVSSVAIWSKRGPNAVDELMGMERAIAMHSATT